jgi:PAS domain S-box-containing protein
MHMRVLIGVAVAAALFGVSDLHAQRLRGLTEGRGTDGARSATHVDVVDIPADSIFENHAIELDNRAWRFKLGDDLAWTSPGFYDTDWAMVVPDAPMSDSLTALARAAAARREPLMGWFRVQLRVDPRLVRRPVVLNVSSHGASEIYLNGELVYSSGGDVTLPGEAARVERPPLPIPVTFNSSTVVLAVRYNVGSQLEVRSALFDPDHFHIAVANEGLLTRSAASTRHEAGVMLSIFGLFAAIGFIHLLLYLFMRQPRSNLYFGIFAALFALYPLTQYFALGATDARLGMLLDQLGTMIAGPAMFALMVFLYAVFLKRLPFTFWVMAVVTLALMFTPFVLGGRNAALASWLILGAFALEGLRVLGIAAARRMDGSRIIGVGFALTFALWGFVALASFRGLALPADVFWASFLGVSLSSSVFLARGFAHNALGFRRMSQELSEVNRSLEAKVAERTLQVEERAAEAERRREYFQAVFENSPVAIVSLDLDGTVTSFNTAFERLFGYTHEEAVGRNIDDLVASGEDRARAIERTLKSAGGDLIRSEIGSRQCKDGSIIEVEHAGIPVEVGGQRVGIIALYHDVTELLRARREAEEASRTKSQFLANMSHELRTPLNAVIGYSEMLMEEAEDAGDGGYLPDLRKIHGSGRHLLGLINDILDLSKIEAGRMELYFETFELAPMIEEVATTIRPLIDKNGNALVLELSPQLGIARLDQVKVRQILFNLLSNASKFTENGTITLTLSRNRDLITFRVADTGIGMTPEQSAKLFQPFMQADASTTKKYGGTGLGLAITRHFCELMGGTIELDSEANRGTIFTVTLPADPAAAQPVVDELRPEALTGASSGTVLVIDDDATARDMLTRMLGKEGYRVVLASSGDEGLRLARDERPDVITLDVLMAGLDGWAVLSRLKGDVATCDIPVVVLTVIDDRNLGFALGAADYLTKPIERERLADALRRVRADERGGPVLVVDDESTVREMLRRILEKDGWRVVEAENGRIALDCMLEHEPAAVLLDLMMPEMDGFTFIDEMRRRGVVSGAPIIVLTAKSLTEADRQRLNGAVSNVLQKGEQSTVELLDEIRRSIDSTRRPAPAGGA